MRPDLECSVQFWTPQYNRDMDTIEFNKMMKELENLSYEERLIELGLFRLEERRLGSRFHPCIQTPKGKGAKKMEPGSLFSGGH